MKESDWKVFKRIKEKAIDTLCKRALAEFAAIIQDESQSAHERYRLHYKRVQGRDKQMGALFDGHSRSKATLQLFMICREGLADKALLDQLSEELLSQINPEKST